MNYAENNYYGQDQDGSIALMPNETRELLFTRQDMDAIVTARETGCISFTTLKRLHRIATETDATLAGHYLQSGVEEGWSLAVERTETGQIIGYTELGGRLMQYQTFPECPHSRAVSAIIARGLGVSLECDGR